MLIDNPATRLLAVLRFCKLDVLMKVRSKSSLRSMEYLKKFGECFDTWISSFYPFQSCPCKPTERLKIHSYGLYACLESFLWNQY